jgi:hypothetical protein
MVGSAGQDFDFAPNDRMIIYGEDGGLQKGTTA